MSKTTTQEACRRDGMPFLNYTTLDVLRGEAVIGQIQSVKPTGGLGAVTQAKAEGGKWLAWVGPEPAAFLENRTPRLCDSKDAAIGYIETEMS